MGSIWLLEGKENKIMKPALVFWIRSYFGFTLYFGFCLYTAILTKFMIFLVPYSEIQRASVWHIALLQELTQIDWKLIKSIDAHSLGQHINQTSTYSSDFLKFTNKSRFVILLSREIFRKWDILLLAIWGFRIVRARLINK